MTTAVIATLGVAAVVFLLRRAGRPACPWCRTRRCVSAGGGLARCRRCCQTFENW